MTAEFVAVPEVWTAQQVIDHIRTQGKDKETIHVIYIVDTAGKLIDDLRILQILLSPPETPIRQIRDDHFVALRATNDRATALKRFVIMTVLRCQ